MGGETLSYKLRTSPETPPEAPRGERIRLIAPEPRIGLTLKAREPLILPKPLYEWATDWVTDVGAIMRDRTYMASFVAGIIQYSILLTLFRLVPGLREAVPLHEVLGLAPQKVR
ncbi:MAG: hypothetical protein QW356_04640 [Candidatus Hadarchaeales archaeon]